MVIKFSGHWISFGNKYKSSLTVQKFLCNLPSLSFNLIYDVLELLFSPLQVLINGLHHFVPLNVKPKLQMVETFIKVWISVKTHFLMICVDASLIIRFCNSRVWNLCWVQTKMYYLRIHLCLSLLNQAYYLPETEFVHWARAHPVRTLHAYCVTTLSDWWSF